MQSKSRESYSRNQLIAISFLFAISYAILYFFSLIGDALSKVPFLDYIFPMHGWDSPTYLLVPIAGFFLTFFIIEWITSHFESNISHSIAFPVLFAILCLLAFYVNMFFFFYPSYGQNAHFEICILPDSACNNLQQSLVQKYQSQGIALIFPRFWAELKNTSFIYFMFSGLLAWLSAFIVRKLKEKQYI